MSTSREIRSKKPRTGIQIAAGALLTLLLLGLFWVYHGVREKERLLTHDTEIVVNDKTDVLRRNQPLVVQTMDLSKQDTEAQFLREDSRVEQAPR
ncbi:MAG: hypothetical protein WC314_07320 [Vulcanimicrobiota bacterium]